MLEFEVGKPRPDTMAPPIDTWQFNVTVVGYTLDAWLSRPSTAEVEAARVGDARFGLYVRDDLLILLHKFGRGQWGDSPFNWHAVPEEGRWQPDPELGPAQRAPLQVMMMDRVTGIIETMRLVTFSPQFSTALNRAIARQIARGPCSEADYDAQLARAYRLYPTTDAMAKAADITCKGGE